MLDKESVVFANMASLLEEEPSIYGEGMVKGREDTQNNFQLEPKRFGQRDS